jgi:GntR family transcriptional regulator
LHDSLGALIAQTQPGDKLLSEPELARQLGVSRATLREAMRTFETQGVIRRRQGSGTYVVHPAPVMDSGLEMLESIETLAERIGLSVSMGEMRINLRPCSIEEANNLSIPAGSNVIHLIRVILAEDRQIAYLVDIIPDDLLKPQELTNDFTGSVLDLFIKRGSPILTSARCDINAVNATKDVARSLGIQRGVVLLRFESFLYDIAGRVVDYSFSYFLPGYFRFHVVRRVG